MKDKNIRRMLILACSFFTLAVLGFFVFPAQREMTFGNELIVLYKQQITVYWAYFWFYLLFGLWILLEPSVTRFFNKNSEKKN